MLVFTVDIDQDDFIIGGGGVLLVGVEYRKEEESSEDAEQFEKEEAVDEVAVEVLLLIKMGIVFNSFFTTRAFLTQCRRRVSTRKPEDIVLHDVQSQLPYSHPSLSTL